MNSGIVCRKCQRLGRAACFCWLEWGEVVPIRQVGRAPEEEADAKASGARKPGENRRERMPAARPSGAGSTAGPGRYPFSPRIRTLQGILDKLEPPPVRKPLPAACASR
jgi:hypothetical protein